MAKYILSPQAQKSLKQVRSYTLKNHGKMQTRTYLKMLRDGMRDIAKKPETSGVKRNEIKKGYYSMWVGRHTIYYRICVSHVDIIDILHQKMDPSRYL